MYNPIYNQVTTNTSTVNGHDCGGSEQSRAPMATKSRQVGLKS